MNKLTTDAALRGLKYSSLEACFPIDLRCWPMIADAIQRPWPEEAMLMDMRFWSRLETEGLGRRPGRPALEARWGVTPRRARSIMEDVDAWADPAHPPPPKPERASIPDGFAEDDDCDEDLGLVSHDATWTHDALVAAGFRFLTARVKCTVAVSEFVSAAQSIPDVIGWRYGQTHMVEAKRSRSDFRADRDKPSHRAGRVPGQRRWYVVPFGLVQAAEVPEGWGMVWVRRTPSGAVRFRVVLDAPPVPGHPAEEMTISASLCRRLRDGGKICETTGRITAWRDVTP